MKEYEKASLIFVVGRPRSGTNFIRSILNLHSKIWISGEPSLWIKGRGNGVIDLIAHLRPFDSDNKIQQLFDILGSGRINGKFWTYKKLDLEQLRKEFEDSDRQYRDLLWLALSQRGRANQKTIFGEKTPHNLYHLKELSTWYPKAKFIHIIRDPRAVFVSEIHRVDVPHNRLKKPNPFRNLGIFLYVLTDWKRNIRYHNKYLDEYPGHYHMVRFSELYNNIKETTENLCFFVGIEYEVAMSDPPRRRSSFDKEYDPLNGWRGEIPWLYKFLFDFLLGSKIRKYA
jgi:hypothetical protein